MEVLLLEDVEKLGYEGDMVSVKPGYARNFLIPRGKAITATSSNKKMIEENRRQAAHKLQKLREEAEAKADQLNAIEVTISAKTGTTNKIFGSITTQQVTAALEEQGFDVDRRNVSLAGAINELGTYTAEVRIHRDVTASVTVNVVREGGDPEPQPEPTPEVTDTEQTDIEDSMDEITPEN